MHGAARAGSVDFPPLWKFEDASLAPLTRSPRSNTTAGALVSSSGRYRIELCEGWKGCSDGPEYIGFNNKTCVAGVPPVSKTYGNTVGPLLRSSGVSNKWRTWVVDVVSKKADRTIVTINNDYSQARCTKHYIDDYSEKKDACKGTVWSDRVHLHKFPGEWTVKAAKGTNGKCFNIINHQKASGCLRYLSANADCEERHLKLVEKDDGKGLQQWKFVKVSGGGGDGGTPSPSLPGSTCVSTGPNNCAACCKSKFETLDGSFLDDQSCLDTDDYPQCSFESVPTPTANKPSIVSSTALTNTTGSLVIKSPVGTTTAEVSVSGTDSPPSTITVYQPSGISTVIVPNLAQGTKHDVTVDWKGPSGVTSQTTTVTTLPSTMAIPGPILSIPTATNLYPLNATAVRGNANPGGPGCSSGLATAVLSGSSLSSPIDSDFVFLLSGLQPETTYTVTVSFDCNGTSVTSTPSSVTMPSKTPAPPAPPVPAVITPPAAVEVSNVQSCYPTVSVTTIDADPNTLLEVGILCLDQTGGGNDFLSETFVPVDAANTKNGQFLTVVSIGHVPVGEKCSVQAFNSVVGSTDQSKSVFADFVIPANNVCTDYATLNNPTFNPGTKATDFNVGKPQSTCDPIGYSVTAVPTTGANVTATAVPGASPTVSVPLVPGVAYDDLLVTVDCKDGNSVTSSYGAYGPFCPPIANCQTTYLDVDTCKCFTCANGFTLSQTGSECVANPPAQVLCGNEYTDQTKYVAGIDPKNPKGLIQNGGMCYDDAPDLKPFCENYYKNVACGTPGDPLTENKPYPCVNIKNFKDGSRVYNRYCESFSCMYSWWYETTSDNDRCQMVTSSQISTLEYECTFCCGPVDDSNSPKSCRYWNVESAFDYGGAVPDLWRES